MRVCTECDFLSLSRVSFFGEGAFWSGGRRYVYITIGRFRFMKRGVFYIREQCTVYVWAYTCVYVCFRMCMHAHTCVHVNFGRVRLDRASESCIYYV